MTLHFEKDLSKEEQGEGRWGVGGCHSECITLTSGVYKKLQNSVIFSGCFRYES